jgi:transposase InsO family protein
MKTRSRQVIVKTKSKRTATASGSVRSGSSISASPSQSANSTEQSGEMSITMTKTGGVVTTNVKCPVTLDREGVEFPLWDLGYVAACGLKRCKAAIKAPMPETEENAAALLMLIESVPKAWGAKLAAMKVAANAYKWVRARFTEGADEEVTARWLELLHTSMRETETLEDYYNRKVALFNALKGNGHSIMEREAKLAIIKGLPEEAKETGMISSSAGKDLEGLWEIISTTAKGLGFNDQVPRVTPVARAAITPAHSTTPGTASSQETQAGGQGGQASSAKVEGRDRRANRRCHYCNKPGHFERNCLKKEADEKMHQVLQQVMAAMANLLPQFQNQASAAVARPPEGSGDGNNFFPGEYPPPSGMSAMISLNVLTPTRVMPEARSFMVDSGATIHLVNDLSLLHSPTLHRNPIPLHMATSDATGQIIATGSLCLSSAEQQPLWLHNVHCVPSATANLISVTAAIRDGASFVTDSVGSYTGMRARNWSCSVAQRNGLYFLQKVSPVRNPVHVSVNTARAPVAHDCRLRALWHSILGHPGEVNMRRLQSEDLVLGIPVSLSPCANCPSSCEACIQGKHSRPPFGASSRAATEPLERIHLDTVGPISPTALTGERFFVTIVDEATHYVIALAIKTKDAISSAVRDLLIFWQRQLNRSVKCIRTDRGTEFLNSTLKGFCTQEGIKFETSAAYSPQQNGVAEWMNRTIKEKARTLLLHAAAKQSLWKEAVETACILYNMGPVTGRDQTPYEAFHGVKPDVSLLRTFGCLAHVHIPDHQRGVFEYKTSQGFFTGYSSVSKAYRIYLGNGIWKESRDVTFLEHIRGADRVGLSTMSPVSPNAV